MPGDSCITGLFVRGKVAWPDRGHNPRFLARFLAVSFRHQLEGSGMDWVQPASEGEWRRAALFG